MIVRITKETDGGQTIIHLEGRLRCEVVPELERECQSVDGPLVLDLSQLLAADRTGIEAIRDLVSGGAEFRGASRYVQMLLDDEG
jgi:anti-anti-sigma regulatory factor